MNSSPPWRLTVVAGADRVEQATRDRAQEPVAHVMAERIVDGLEVVEVDEQQRDLAAVARGGIDRFA